jgi:hypothetical protein
MLLLDRVTSWKRPVFLLSLLSYWHTGVMMLSHEVCLSLEPLLCFGNLICIRSVLDAFLRSDITTFASRLVN